MERVENMDCSEDIEELTASILIQIPPENEDYLPIQ